MGNIRPDLEKQSSLLRVRSIPVFLDKIVAAPDVLNVVLLTLRNFDVAYHTGSLYLSSLKASYISRHLHEG